MIGRTDERWQVEVDARLARLELQAEEAQVVEAGLGRRPSRASHSDEAYPDLNTWVSEYFCTTFKRPLGGEFRWCAQWTEHREAVVRLDALWCSWKVLRQDPVLGMSTWLTQFFDPQFKVLLNAQGPFSACSPTRHDS